jgi:hypothetical protein
MENFSIDKIYRKVTKIIDETQVYEHGSAVTRYTLLQPVVCD